MRHFHTVVLERMSYHGDDFNTEPYEAAWASEAIFFIRVHSMAGKDMHLDATVQLSVDGIDWVDDDLSFPTITGEGTYFLRVRHFGGWLRLRTSVEGKDVNARLSIHLVLKE